MPNENLTTEQARDLRALAGTIIPPSETYGVPGADDKQIFKDILGSLERDHDDICRALAHLATLAGGAFADLGPERRTEVAAAFREAGGAPLAALVRVVLLCYYRDDRVMPSLGQEPRAPFPKGHVVEQGDWSLLDPGARAAANVSRGRVDEMSTNSGGANLPGRLAGQTCVRVRPTAVRSTCHYKRRKKRVWCFNHLLNGEAIMRFRTTGTLALALSLGAMALGASAAAQTTSAPPAITRTVIAAAKLPTATDVPLFFKAASVTIPSGENSSVSAANSIVYQISGSTEVSLDGGTKILNAGDGLFIAGGKTSVLKAGSGGPSSFLHFLLAPAAEVDRPAEQAPAAVRELYRTAAPIPDLKPGGYDLNLTRVTFPAQMPSNPPHHRSGAALYYIISGTGANTVDGTTTEKAPGSLIYEPYALVHQWGNPGSEPLTFLAFNINPEGVAAVLPGTPPKNQ